MNVRKVVCVCTTAWQRRGLTAQNVHIHSSAVQYFGENAVINVQWAIFDFKAT